MRGWPPAPSAPCSTISSSAKVPAGTTDRLWFSDMHDHRVVATDRRRRREHGRRDHRRRAVRPRMVARRPPPGRGHGDPATAAGRARRRGRGARRPVVGRARLAQRHDRRRRRHRVPRRHGGAHPRARRRARAGQTFRVAPDGTWECAADDLQSPNGHILTDDGRTLIVAESGGMRLTAFTVRADGTLTDRRTYAELAPERDDVAFAPPDGICLDAEGAVWVADPHRRARVPRPRGRRGHRHDRLHRRPSRSRACSAVPIDARCSCAQPPTGSATRSPAGAPGGSTRARSTCPARAALTEATGVATTSGSRVMTLGSSAGTGDAARAGV